MKNNIYILGFLLSLILLTGFGCENTEVVNNFGLENCPELKDGWETKTTSRYEFETQAESTTWPQLFTNDNDWGLRCLYYEPEGEAFDITHAEGQSYGNWQNHYEMEIRTFTYSEPKDEYYEENVTEILNNYCGDTRQLVTPLLLRDGTVNERYQCAWPLEDNGGVSDQINTNTLISITSYRDSIITLAITREMGKSHFVPPTYSGTPEEQKAQAIRARELVYDDFNFISIPDEYEEELVNHALDLL